MVYGMIEMFQRPQRIARMLLCIENLCCPACGYRLPRPLEACPNEECGLTIQQIITFIDRGEVPAEGEEANP